jgi:hypothetical protein
VHIQGAPLDGSNTDILYRAGLSIGYVPNDNSVLTGQIVFEREDGEWFSSVYNQDNTNKLVILNASVAGGGGIGLHTASSTPISFASVSSANDTLATPFCTFTRSQSNIMSTVNSSNKTSGALVITGGLAVGMNLHSETDSRRYDLITVSDDQVISMSETSGIVILTAPGTVSNLIVNLPDSNIAFDGQMSRLSSMVFIENMTLGNTSTTINNMVPGTSLHSINVKSLSDWVRV